MAKIIRKGLKCPKCKSHDIEIYDYKAKKRVSAGKAVAAIATGGASLLVTGLRSERKAFFCKECGCVFEA